MSLDPEPFDSDNRMPSARGFDSPDTTRPLRLHYQGPGREDTQRTFVAEPEPVADAVLRVSTTLQETESAPTDELDIPAFLRRAH